MKTGLSVLIFGDYRLVLDYGMFEWEREKRIVVDEKSSVL